MTLLFRLQASRLETGISTQLRGLYGMYRPIHNWFYYGTERSTTLHEVVGGENEEIKNAHTDTGIQRDYNLFPTFFLCAFECRYRFHSQSSVPGWEGKSFACFNTA